MKKVLYYELLRFQPENLARLRESFDLLVRPHPDADDPAELAQISAVFAPLGYYWGRERIDRAPRLRAIASNTTGVPHIDVAYAAARSVQVLSLAGRNDFLSTITPTAEHVWGLLLGVLRRVPWAFKSVVEGGQWNRRPFGGPAMLSRLSLGIVGLGRLGRLVARQALGFGMKVRYYDTAPVVPVEGAERLDSLAELVAASDVVTIHIPHEKRNENLFDARLLARFKPGAYLINTSRGEMVDEAALLAALESGQLAGAGLDVLAGEFVPGFDPRGHPLVDYARTHDNLLLTPHIGGSTRDAWTMTEAYVIDLLIKALREEGSR